MNREPKKAFIETTSFWFCMWLFTLIIGATAYINRTNKIESAERYLTFVKTKVPPNLMRHINNEYNQQMRDEWEAKRDAREE